MLVYLTTLADRGQGQRAISPRAYISHKHHLRMKAVISFTLSITEIIPISGCENAELLVNGMASALWPTRTGAARHSLL